MITQQQQQQQQQKNSSRKMDCSHSKFGSILSSNNSGNGYQKVKRQQAAAAVSASLAAKKNLMEKSSCAASMQAQKSDLMLCGMGKLSAASLDCESATYTKKNYIFLQQYHKKLFRGISNEIERLRKENLAMKKMFIKRNLSRTQQSNNNWSKISNLSTHENPLSPLLTASTGLMRSVSAPVKRICQADQRSEMKVNLIGDVTLGSNATIEDAKGEIELTNDSRDYNGDNRTDQTAENKYSLLSNTKDECFLNALIDGRDGCGVEEIAKLKFGLCDMGNMWVALKSKTLVEKESSRLKDEVERQDQRINSVKKDGNSEARIFLNNIRCLSLMHLMQSIIKNGIKSENSNHSSCMSNDNKNVLEPLKSLSTLDVSKVTEQNAIKEDRMMNKKLSQKLENPLFTLRGSKSSQHDYSCDEQDRDEEDDSQESHYDSSGEAPKLRKGSSKSKSSWYAKLRQKFWMRST